MRNLSKICLLILLEILAVKTILAQNKFDEIVEKAYTKVEDLDSLVDKNSTAELEALAAKSEKAKYYEGCSYALNNLGIYYRNKSEYEKALDYHKRAIKCAEKVKNIDFLISGLNMAGVVYRRQDEIRLAMDYHKRALELAEKSNKTTNNALRNLAVSRNSLGNIYLSINQFDLAEKEFLASIKIEEKVQNKLGLAINYQNLGGIFEEKGLLDKALQYYKRSLAFNEEIDSDIGRVICKNSIGQIYLKQKKTDEALVLIESVFQLSQETGDQFYAAASQLNLGWAYLNKGKYEESEQMLTKSIENSKKRGLKYQVAEGYRLLSELYEKRGEFYQALYYNRLHDANEEQYLNEKNLQYVSDLIVMYDTEKSKNQIQKLEEQNEIVNLRLRDNQKLYALSLLGFLLVGGTFYFLYRQKTLKREKEFLALEQKMLRSQMNPHFIFNALNSIKLYIINNDKEKAVYYLNKFSKLMRTILANSQEKDISLADELQTMELYVNIENIRFSQKINFETVVDPGLDVSKIKVPSMMLQPFIENAIWHGLSHIEKDKVLTVRVKSQDEDFISIEIEDNGIGRVRSAQLKAAKSFKNKSVGIEITSERLDNYFKEFSGTHKLEFIDRMDNEGLAAGTVVKLTLPISKAA